MRLLLDEHINPRVAVALRRKNYDVLTADELGARGSSDVELLRTAASVHRAVVTYNIGDFLALLDEWIRCGRTYWGIVFVSEKTISQRTVGPLVRTLERLLKEMPGEDAMKDQSVYVTKSE